MITQDNTAQGSCLHGGRPPSWRTIGDSIDQAIQQQRARFRGVQHADWEDIKATIMARMVSSAATASWSAHDRDLMQYLSEAVRNGAIDAIRRRTGLRVVSLPTSALRQLPDRPSLQALELRDELEALLGDLRPSERAVVRAYLEHGEAWDVIASLVGLSPRTARAYFYRARSWLQRRSPLAREHCQ